MAPTSCDDTHGMVHFPPPGTIIALPCSIAKKISWKEDNQGSSSRECRIVVECSVPLPTGLLQPDLYASALKVPLECHKLVYISVYDIREELLKRLHIDPVGAIPLEVERYIQQQCDTLDWTILGCPPSYEIFFAMLHGNAMIVPGGGKCTIPCVSSQDVGAIAAQVAVSKSDDWTRHVRIRVCGPQATTFPEMANRISHYSESEIRVVSIPLWLINVVSFVVQPCFPLLRFIYFGMKLLNNFPQDFAEHVPADHAILLQHFDYEAVTLDMEIQRCFHPR